MTNDSENDKNDHVIRSALTPELTCGTEKPPESEDFKAHRHVSLSALTSLVKTKHQSHSQHLLLLLCSEHCAESGKPPEPPHVWSSHRHQELADELVQGLESQADKTLTELLTESDCGLFK